MIQRINTFEETEYFWLIPSAIDLPNILKEHPTAFSYNIHYFYYLIDVICDRMDLLDEKDKIKWVALSSTRLQRFIPNYALHLGYLKERGILDFNPSYRVGEACKGFKISSDYYSGTPLMISITKKDWVIWKKIKKLKVKKNGKKNKIEDDGYIHLSKWFNEKLVIDVQGAKNEMDVIFPRIPILRKYRNSKGKIVWTKKCTRFKCERAVKRLDCKDFYHRIDKKIGRYHTNLTGLKKPMRNYITYDGKNLVNLDIRNSQPLLSGILLNQKFYEKTENYNIWSIKSLQSILSDNIDKLLPCISNICSYIMLGESDNTLTYKEFQQFLTIIQKGTFYKELGEILFPGENKDREEVKITIYTILFTKNKCDPKHHKYKMPFKRKFPTIYSIFNLLKKHDNKVLSHILQRVESYIVVERATRRIAEERPDLPIFTIHDSITTTVGDEVYVEQILKEEIKAVIGLDASIGREYWGKPCEAFNASINQLYKAV